MKKQLIVSVSLILVLMLCLVSCNTVDAEGLWENATHRRDVTFGDGATTVQLEVKVEDQSVTFTIKTDKEILGDALLEHGLISGEEGPYGLYVKEVNGMTADYDTDGLYWAFYQGGAYMLTGVDSTPISGGEAFEIRLEK